MAIKWIKFSLCANLSLRCELLIGPGIILPSAPSTFLSFLPGGTFEFLSICQPLKGFFLPQEQLCAGALQTEDGVFLEQWPGSLVKESLQLIPSPLVQWSKDCRLSVGVLLDGDSNNSFCYLASWVPFWTRAWTLCSSVKGALSCAGLPGLSGDVLQQRCLTSWEALFSSPHQPRFERSWFMLT